MDSQIAAHRMKYDIFPILFYKIEEDVSRSQGSMTAKIYFAARCEPSKFIILIFFDSKCCLLQAIFFGDILHHFIRNPILEQANGCRIPFKNGVSKCICNILPDNKFFHN